MFLATPVSASRSCPSRSQPRRSHLSRLLVIRLAIGLLGAAIGRDRAPAADASSTLANATIVCAACHGTHGEGNAAVGNPRLAGLPQQYILAQLAAFASGARDNPVMTAIAKGLSADQAQSAATYYAGLPGPALTQASPAAGPGRILARRGQWSEGIPACVSCHGPNGIGVGASFPSLAGQPAIYLQSQLRAWQQGKRPPGPLGLMPAVAKRMTAAEIAAVAAWFAGSTQALPRASADTAERASPSTVTASATGATPFRPPPESEIPSGPYGEIVKLGGRIFRKTGNYARPFVGNQLTCGNCHIDAGRLAGASPLWAGWVRYPRYRAKNHRISTFGERLQDCFEFSMNGKAPPLGARVIVALETYSAWLAQGAPVGTELPGRGYPELAPPALAPDYSRGRAVYQEKCALCHGVDGAGQAAAGTVVFPPLWGDHSFNWGAGMQRVDTAAAFIKANMPFGLGGTLSDQAAWDVALFMDSHDRPQDPRFTGSVAETRRKFHDSPWSIYGQIVEGHVLGRDSVPPGGTTRRGD